MEYVGLVDFYLKNGVGFAERVISKNWYSRVYLCILEFIIVNGRLSMSEEIDVIIIEKVKYLNW